MHDSDPRPVFPRRLSRQWLIALDGLAAAAYTSVLLASASARPGVPGWAASLLMAAVGLPVAARRLWPLPVFGVVFAASALSLSLGIGRDSFVAAAFALYVVALREPRDPREPTLLIAVVSGLLLFVATAAGPRNGDAARAGEIVFGVAALGAAWTIGRAVRERRAYAARAAAQLADRAVTEERLRIARELHDVVSHTLSLIGVKAGVAGYVLRSAAASGRSAASAAPDAAAAAGPGGERAAGGAAVAAGAVEETGAAGSGGVDPYAEVADALRVIETTSREALVEMRHMLGMLRSDGTPADLRPAPGVGDLPELADRAAMAGVHVEMAVAGVGDLPEDLGRSVHRIVQEAVTNVIRHAAPARCRVAVEADDREVRIRVTDDGPGDRRLPGRHGHGIIGMRERAHMHGGSLTAGPRAGGGFEVRAWLPRPAHGWANGTGGRDAPGAGG